MAKLRLEMESLEVEAFSTTHDERLARGTVQGHQTWACQEPLSAEPVGVDTPDRDGSAGIGWYVPAAGVSSTTCGNPTCPDTVEC